MSEDDPDDSGATGERLATSRRGRQWRSHARPWRHTQNHGKVGLGGRQGGGRLAGAGLCGLELARAATLHGALLDS